MVGGQQGYIISNTLVYHTNTPSPAFLVYLQKSCWSYLQNKHVPTPSIPHTLSNHLSATTQTYRLNNTGARVQPCCKSFSTLISLSISPTTHNLAFMLSWKDLVMSIRWSGTPSFLKATHRASLGTESYAFFKSTNIKYCFAQCSITFSVSCLMVNIISAHPRPLLKPHWDSGNSLLASTCSLFWIILATTFPISSKSVILRQLSQMCRLPFFGMGIRIASIHSSWGLSSLSRQSRPDLQSVSWNPHSCIPPSLEEYLNFLVPSHSSTFPRLWPSQLKTESCLDPHPLLSASPSPSFHGWYWLLTFSTLVKCLLQHCCCEAGVLHGSSLSSLMVITLDGTKPLQALCISQMHFHTTFPPKLCLCDSSAFAWNHALFACLIAFLATLIASLSALDLPSYSWPATWCRHQSYSSASASTRPVIPETNQVDVSSPCLNGCLQPLLEQCAVQFTSLQSCLPKAMQLKLSPPSPPGTPLPLTGHPHHPHLVLLLPALTHIFPSHSQMPFSDSYTRPSWSLHTQTLVSIALSPSLNCYKRAYVPIFRAC